MANGKTILFDIDGTLVDSNEFHVEAWAAVFDEAGHSVPRDAIRGQIGKGGDNLVPTLLPDLDEETVETLSDRHGEVFKPRFLDRVVAFPGARDLLARVRAEGGTVVLASSAGQEELDHYLDLLDARELVTATTCIDDVEHSKPDPDIFAAALEKAGVEDPRQAVVVGDTPFDIAAAKACGIPAIGVLSGGFPAAVLEEAGAVAIYPDVGALLAGYAASPLASEVAAQAG